MAGLERVDAPSSLWARLIYKFRHLVLLLALVAASFVAVYTALDWLLVAGTGWLPIDQDVVNFWLPMVLACVPVALFVAPGIRTLRLSERRNIPFLYQIVAAATIAAPTSVAQHYLDAASGRLTHVTDTAAIPSASHTKYYRADSICIYRPGAQVYPVTQMAGEHNQDLDFFFYVVVPVCADSGDADRAVWIGLVYHDSMSNSATRATKEAEYKAFAERSQRRFNHLDASRYTYLERAPVSTARRGFEKALRKAGVTTSAVILVPHTEPFVDRTGNLFPWIFGAFAIGIAGWTLLVLIAPFDPEQFAQEQRRRTNPPPWRKSVWASIFIPQTHSYGFPILLDANIAVFLCMVFAGLGVANFQPDDLLSWGALYGPALHGLGVLRLLTSQFVHAGLMHIMGNMYGLIFACMFLDAAVRNLRLIACYLITGIAGNLLSLLLHPTLIVVGASGAIMGLWGILIALVVARDARIMPVKNAVLMNATIFVGFTLVIGELQPGIANAAHVGGVLAGFILGVGIWLLDRNRVPNDPALTDASPTRELLEG